MRRDRGDPSFLLLVLLLLWPPCEAIALAYDRDERSYEGSGAEIEGLQSHSGGTTLKFEILTEEVHECILWLSIVFITILCTPQPTVVRWLPVKTLQLEQMAVMGSAEEISFQHTRGGQSSVATSLT
ncbi:hypothetical protein OPV22_014916 [Ensete ventricosum]|uniref:DUF7876 domain-containing protein n=1 Tax=Ensete ventricosum TaxID=4639 RepID=A0AAV8RBS2_ENSVE|nr:hypothetical protein OPV22_014916 [Ensete ventricosum]